MQRKLCDWYSILNNIRINNWLIRNNIIITINIVVGAIDIIWSTTTWIRGLISQYINYDVLNQYHHFLYLLVSS